MARFSKVTRLDGFQKHFSSTINYAAMNRPTNVILMHRRFPSDSEVPTWASGRPYRVVVSSAAGLIITVTDGEGGVIKREAGCATGPCRA